MVERPSTPYRQTFREPLIIFAFQALSFIITGVVFYALYTLLYPYLAITAPTTGGVTVTPGGPPAPDRPLILELTDRLAFILIVFLKSRGRALLFYLLLVMAAFMNEISYIPLALYHKIVDRRREEIGLRNPPRMSVIIPAHNEEKTIEATVLSVLESNYPNFEVIVVNDGSTDGTKLVLAQLVSAGKIALIDRPQGGKAVAVNTGVAVSSGEVILVIDADVAVERDVLSKLAVHFQDPAVAAVSGNIQVGNRPNLLTKLQALEYIRDLNLRRRAFDILDTIPVIPGATGAFRKSALKRIGGMDKDTVVEDMDLTLRIVKAADDVRFESHALSYTEAPENISAWARQRMRWYGGTLQCFLKHRKMWWKFGPLSFIGFPYLFVSMFFIPVIELATMGLLFVYIYQQLFFGVLLAVLSFLVIELVLSILAIMIDGEDWRLILYTPLYTFYYRFLVDAVRLRSYSSVLRGRLGWYRTGRYGELLTKIKPA